MFEFLRVYQVNIMLGLASICLVIALFTAVTRTLAPRRKIILLFMEICAATWLFADRVAYEFHGVPGETAATAVRVSNFLVFLMTVSVLYCINKYFEDVLRVEGELGKEPIPLKVGDVLASAAMILIIISQFTGLYYTFDENNTYQRAPLYFISYIFPYMILLIQTAMLIVHRKRLKGKVAFSMVMFDSVCLIASAVQYFAYGVSLMDMAAVLMVIVVYLFALLDMNERVESANKIIITHLQNEQESMKRLFNQTASVLAEAIDAKKGPTKGRSLRIAQYSREIARRAGKDEKTCDEVYYSALLHDVGKIMLPDSIVSREGQLSDEETEIFKKHAEIGGELLSKITEYPFLSAGAKSHNERFDGQGYPDGLKGKGVPEFARIIAIADAYDSMTSKVDFHEPLPQRTVREELIKGSGSRFDPDYIRAVVEMIDHDTEYLLKEKDDSEAARIETDLSKTDKMHFGEYKETVSDGIRINSKKTRIHLETKPDKGSKEKISIPTLILFDSFDGCVHKDDRSIRILSYMEYAEIWFDGHYVSTAARRINPEIRDYHIRGRSAGVYDIEAVRYSDHAKITITGDETEKTFVIALPDAVRFMYLGVTGEHCTITNVRVEETKDEIGDGYIPRIADEVSYIERVQGDIPNVQILGYRAAATESLKAMDGLRLMFHAQSLPMSTLIWHCPYILLFSSDDGKPQGPHYSELACIRLDGENATSNGVASNEITVHRTDAFESWDGWKEFTKKGFESEVELKRRRNRITLTTANGGISVKCVTTVPEKTENVYVALTGDQCAITNIRVLF